MSDDGTTASPDSGSEHLADAAAVPQPQSSGAAYRLIEEGRAFENQGRLREAEESYRQAIEVLRPLIAHDASSLMRPHLAYALSGLGGVYRQLGEYAQSELCHREAVALYRQLVEQEGRTHLAQYLAQEFNKHGHSLRKLRRDSEAEQCRREHVALCRKLLDQQGSVEAAGSLAAALGLHGSVLEKLDRLAEAEQCYRESVAMWRVPAAEWDPRATGISCLASALDNHVGVLRRLGRFFEAEQCQRERVEIERRLAGPRDSWRAKDLAFALREHGWLLMLLEHPGEANACLVEAVGIHRTVAEQKPEDAVLLAYALREHGDVLKAVGHLLAAEQCHHESAGILKHWAETKDRGFEFQLAFSLRARGNLRQTLGRALRDRRRLRGAAQDFTDVIRIEKSRPASEESVRRVAEAEQACAQVLGLLERQFP